ncbi:MAG: YjbF family lipoprotein [Roseovarius sp.]|nr:YjbF family lipoprotein [Roseovarius sp.]
MRSRYLQTAFAGLACVLLASCGSESSRSNEALGIFKGALRPSRTAPQDPQQVAASAQAALASTNAPLVLVSISERNVSSVMQQIETNGAYRTYGTGDRRSITFKGGMMTASRGLGEDLMSSDVDGVLALVSARKAGRVQRVHRYLDGENTITALEATCEVTPGAMGQVSVDTGQRATQNVTETCRAVHTEFQNTYMVDRGTGHILQSRQWHSPMNGYISVQTLRP